MIRFFSLLAVLCAVTLTSALHAEPAATDPRTASPEPFRGFDAACGHRIERMNTTRLSQAFLDPYNGPVIALDPSLDDPKQWFHRKFLIAHECAHHRMKHTTSEGIADRIVRQHAIRDQELSADCWAAEALTRAGYVTPLLQLADQFWRRGFVSPGGGYPAGIQRSNVIRHCSRLAAREMRRRWAALETMTTRDRHP